MYPAKPAGQTGPCGILWTLVSPGSGLQHGFGGDCLFRQTGI